MTDNPKHLFWDSCCFIRYLTQTPTTLVQDLEDYIEDAKRGDRTIYYSTLIYAEIRPSHLRRRGYGDINDLLKDLEGAFEPIDPNPNVLANVGVMRDVPTIKPPNCNITNGVVLGTPDAIHLATCLYVRDELRVSDVLFHTLDATVGKNWEGRTVPIIGLENWYAPNSGVVQIENLRVLPRKLPIHPQPRLIPMQVPDVANDAEQPSIVAPSGAQGGEP